VEAPGIRCCRDEGFYEDAAVKLAMGMLDYRDVRRFISHYENVAFPEFNK
jgi:hypothetical protein